MPGRDAYLDGLLADGTAATPGIVPRAAAGRGKNFEFCFAMRVK